MIRMLSITTLKGTLIMKTTRRSNSSTEMWIRWVLSTSEMFNRIKITNKRREIE
jgi:hypothetical protein